VTDPRPPAPSAPEQNLLAGRVEELERELHGLRVAQRAARVGAWWFDVRSRKVTWSDAAAEIQEAGDEREVSPERAAAFYAPEHRDRIIQAVTACVTDGTPFDEEYEILTPSGRRVWARSIGEAVRNEKGRVIRVQGAFQDISARKQAELAAQAAAVRVHGLLESLSDAFFILDDKLRFTYLNRAAELILGRRREELLGRRIGKEYPDAEGDVFFENYRRTLKEQRMVEFEAPYAPLGLWLEVRVHPADGGLAVSLREVSERRRERDDLRQSVERFRSVAQATSDAIWDWDIWKDETWWSEGMEALFGHPVAELGADAGSWTRFIHEEDRLRVVLSIQDVLTGVGDKWSHEYRFARKDGSWAWVFDRGFVIRDAEGRAVRMVGGMTDLTQRREAELELARLNRALRMRSACNESLIGATDESELLTGVCRIAVEIGGYRMAWVGYAIDDEVRSIRPMAHAGVEDGYLSEVALSWAEDQPGGRGPAGRAVRCGDPVVVENLLKSPPSTPWYDMARSKGYRSIVSLPLRDGDQTFGLLSLYSAESRSVTADEAVLLQHMADDLAFGVVSLRARRQRERMQLAVSKMASVVSAATSEEFFDQLVRNMCEALGADAGYVGTFLPGGVSGVRAIAAVQDGRAVQLGEVRHEGKPFGALLDNEEVVVAGGVADRFPGAPELGAMGAEGWVGRRLDNPRGARVGVIAALFREPIVDVELATSTLRIFAARAVAELERLRLETLKVEQTGILERIAAGAGLAEIVSAATRLIESRVGGAVAAISLVEDDGRMLRLFAGESLPAALREAVASVKIGPGAGICGTAAHERRTTIVAEMQTDPLTEAWRDVIAQSTVRAGWSVPFFAGDSHLLGTLTVYLSESRTPDPDELELVAVAAHVVGIAVERERTHAVLRASEERVRTTFAAAAAGIAISSLGAGGFFQQANQAFCEMVGYTEEELRRLDATALTHPDDLAETFEMGRRLLSGEADRAVIEKRYVRKDGAVVWARVSVSMVPAAEGRAASIIAVTQDITALKAAGEVRESLEHQLREAQKMEAVGTLAGGIAHDFNNILGAILGNAELARLDAEGNESVQYSLEEIRRAGLRAKELIRQILSFSRREKTARNLVSILPIVEESVRLLKATLPSRAAIELRVFPPLRPIHADPVQIQQVLLNLGTNAVHAMAGRAGSVEFRIDTVVLDESSTRLHPALGRGTWVHVSVEDKGHGMDEATRQRIFEPFFTTKPVGEGTGLGLPVVHGILRDHEAAITVESTPGVGTRFDLYFPAASAVSAAPPVASVLKEEAASASEGAGRSILYVDDDKGLLSLIERLLRKRGYRVSGYVEADAALAELRANPDRYDLVLTDYNMPRVSGFDVARAVRDLRPDLPVAITSGYITEAMRSDAQAAGVRALIFKPDIVEELCDEVSRVLAEFGVRRD